MVGASTTANTDMNVGVRRFIYTLDEPEYRNFEPNVLYASAQAVLTYQGVAYTIGQTIPFDGVSVYSDIPLMERWFNAGIVNPITAVIPN